MSGVCINLRSGETAFVDESDAKAVADYKWTWMSGRGVAAYFHGQTILMHNLIAPHARVSFKDGDKLNCRRENLIEYKPVGWSAPPKKNATKGNVAEIALSQRFEVHRKVIEGGEVFRWATSVSWRTRGVPAARKIAKAIAKAIREMSREDFIAFVKEARSKRTCAEVVSGWSAMDGFSLTEKDLRNNRFLQNRDEY